MIGLLERTILLLARRSGLNCVTVDSSQCSNAGSCVCVCGGVLCVFKFTGENVSVGQLLLTWVNCC